MDYDVIVVGAGISGLSVAALLANAGKTVLILEKESNVGGRIASTTYQGQPFECTPHWLTGAGHIEDIFEALGKPLTSLKAFEFQSEYYRDNRWTNLFDVLDRKTFRSLMGEIFTSSCKELAQYNDVTVKDWVSARTQDASVHEAFWQLAVGAYGGSKYEDFSAGAVFSFYKEILDKRGSLKDSWYFMEEGPSAITGPLCNAIKEKGGELRTGSSVVRIVIEGDQAIGVELETEDRLVPTHVPKTEIIRAQSVICALPIWNLSKVIARDDFPGWFIDWIEAIKERTNRIAFIEYGLDGVLEDWQDISIGRTLLPNDTRSGAIIVGNYIPYAGAAPRIGFYQIGYYDDLFPILKLDEAANRKEMNRHFDRLEADINTFSACLDKHTLWQQRHTGVAFLAAMPGMTGHHLPPMQPPGIGNLYFTGDYTRESQGLGVQSCACAAKICADRLLSSASR